MRRVGRCGNCNGWVWSDQDSVEWEGMVTIHSDCWESANGEKSATEDT